jgi:NTP pyrophosphatase (non-canonical NTP hydrolase)
MACPTCGHLVRVEGDDEEGTNYYVPVESDALAEREAVRLRPEVRWFAAQMEQKRRENDRKGGWRDCGLAWLMVWIIAEQGELADAIDHGTSEEIIAEAADVANFAMMLADTARALRVGELEP